MPTIKPNTTLAQLVIAHPELAPRFDALGLDYCCGGQRSLSEAVATAGLDLGIVTAELQATPPRAAHEAESTWDGMDGLVDHLEATHHAYLRDALPRLAALADKVAGVHGTNHPELANVAALVHEIRADLDPHLLREEQVLFPMIRELAAASEAPTFHCGSLINPIRVMLSEHDTVGELLARIRTSTGDFQVPDDGCGSYQALYAGLAELEADTHLHVHKENNVLFPAVLEMEHALRAATT
ncbi:MAG: iron-sulfur cluster repair di-iron protein [Acidimicrobiales bacterium]|nr:iron-sulfur cluster repair di-iron protein [Acidimicrobiales bacterium]